MSKNDRRKKARARLEAERARKETIDIAKRLEKEKSKYGGFINEQRRNFNRLAL